MSLGNGRLRTIDGLLKDLKKPVLNRKVSKLRKALSEAVTCLDTELNFIIKGKARKLWFPSIQQGFKPKISRREAIVICGNISKHNHLVLSRKVETIKGIFLRSDVSITVEEGLELIPEFYAHFHDDIFNYQITKTIELLNNIRWEIYHYSNSFFEKNASKKCEGKTTYHAVPTGVTDKLIRHLFYDLLHYGAREPYVKRFTTWKWMKKNIKLYTRLIRSQSLHHHLSFNSPTPDYNGYRCYKGYQINNPQTNLPEPESFEIEFSQKSAAYNNRNDH